MRAALILAIATFTWGVAAEAAAQAATTEPSAHDTTDRGWWVAPAVHATLISPYIDRDRSGFSGGVAFVVGRRWHDIGLFVQIDHTWWAEPVLDVDNPEPDDVFEHTPQGVLAVAAGLERLYVHNRMRFMASAGGTILLRRTPVDTRGKPGFWVDFRPAGIRFPLGRRRFVTVDPLGFTLLLPDMSGIPLVLFQFRTSVTIDIGVGGAS